MGKVINLKDEAFNRIDKSKHATTVYIHNMNNEVIQEESSFTNDFKPSKDFIPFGEPIPRDWTLVGKLDKLKPGVK